MIIFTVLNMAMVDEDDSIDSMHNHLTKIKYNYPIRWKIIDVNSYDLKMSSKAD